MTNQTTAQHTPGPWLIQSHTMADKEFAVGPVTIDYDDVDHDEQEANAAFIIRACNSYDALVSALGQLLDRLNYHGSIDPIREEGPIKDARTALTAATKET